MTIMSTEMDPEIIALMSEDSSLACDNSELEWCSKGEAKWVAHIQCPDCEASRPELWCSPCKDLVLVTGDGFECGQCGSLIFPARRFVARFDPIGE